MCGSGALSCLPLIAADCHTPRPAHLCAFIFPALWQMVLHWLRSTQPRLQTGGSKDTGRIFLLYPQLDRRHSPAPGVPDHVSPCSSSPPSPGLRSGTPGDLSRLCLCLAFPAIFRNGDSCLLYLPFDPLLVTSPDHLSLSFSFSLPAGRTSASLTPASWKSRERMGLSPNSVRASTHVEGSASGGGGRLGQFRGEGGQGPGSYGHRGQ